MKTSICLFLALYTLACSVGAESLNSVDKNYQKAKDLIRQKAFPKAIELLENIYSQKQHNKDYIYNLAISHYRNGNLSRAKQLFEKLVDQESYMALANLNLGLIESKNDNLSSARVYLENAIRHDNNGKVTPLAKTMLNRIDKNNSGFKLVGDCFCYLFLDTSYENKSVSIDEESPPEETIEHCFHLCRI